MNLNSIETVWTVRAIRCLFQLDPDDMLKCLMKKGNSNTIGDKQGDGKRRKRVLSNGFVVSPFCIAGIIEVDMIA